MSSLTSACWTPGFYIALSGNTCAALASAIPIGRYSRISALYETSVTKPSTCPFGRWGDWPDARAAPVF